MEKPGVSFSYRADFWNQVGASLFFGFRQWQFYFLGFFLAYLFAPNFYPESRWMQRLIAVMGAGVLPLVLVPFLVIWSAWRLRRTRGWYKEDWRFQLNESGFSMENPSFALVLPWEKMRRVIETRRYFLFLTSGKPGAYVVKRKVDTALWPVIRTFIRHGVPKSRLKD